MIDLDRFKKINDTHGHDVGDRVLKIFAQTGAKILRDVDFLARFGGEEFIALLPETDANGAGVTAERLRQAVESCVVTVDDQTLHFTISLGVAVWSQKINTVHKMFTAADKALYSAKQEGRNRVAFH